MPLERYYHLKRRVLNCRIITPMFLGNANQEAEWRAAPFKSLLRYWWRVTQHGQPNHNQLLQKEGELFGYAGNDSSNKSMVQIILPIPAIPSCQNNMPKIDNIHHPEVDKNNGNINPLLYLAGMGLLNPHGSVKHSYFPDENEFHWLLNYPKNLSLEIEKTLSLIQAFGAIGGRSRNGWGSFQITDSPVSIEDAKQYLNQFTIKWEDGFIKDFPNCLGKDEKGALLWKTNLQTRWETAMRDLAVAYVAIRNDGMSKLDPGDKEDRSKKITPRPGERHLLGIPLTHHPGNWGSSARHASPLRFIVHKVSQGFIGFVIHLPHLHSTNMPFLGSLNTPSGQIKVWEKVHRKLDALMPRAAYGECL